MKMYISYFKLRFITNLQYRADALAGTITQIFFGLIFTMIYIAFYESGGNNIPLKLQETITYVWLQQAFFALIYPYQKDQELLDIISNGNLAYELIRPQNFYFKWYIKMISKKMVATLLRFMPVLILAFLLPEPFKMTLPYSIPNFIIFVISLFLGLLLVSSLNLIVHILTMFTLDGKGSITMYGVVAETFMGSIVPLPFLPIWMQKIGNFLPFKYIGDFPFRIYSNSITLSYGYKLLIGSFIWIIILNLIGLFISKIALRKAVIQGG